MTIGRQAIVRLIQNPPWSRTKRYRSRGKTPELAALERQFILEPDDLADNLIRRLEQFISDPSFKGRITVVNLPAIWESVVQQLAAEHPAVKHVYYEKTSKPGLSKLFHDTLPSNFAGFSLAAIPQPSEQEMEGFLESLIQEPPKIRFPYYVGELPPSDLDSLFPSGKLADLNKIPGVNTLYGHFGDKGSGTAFHTEDARFRSYNLVLAGYKLWVMISTAHTARFEELVNRCSPRNQRADCAQFVRHRALLFSLRRLREEGIDFDVLIAGPGVMVVTEPLQYHCVINVTPCFAIATNFVLSDEEALPTGIACCEDCGLYELLRSDTGSDSGYTSAGASRITSPLSARQKRLAEPNREPEAKRKKTTKPPASGSHIRTLAGVCSGKHAFGRLCSLITGWRDYASPPIQAGRTQDRWKRSAQLIKLSEQSENRALLSRLISCLANLQLAREADQEKNDYARMPPEYTKKLLGALGWTNDQKSRKRLQNHLLSGRKWNRLCGPMPGLMPLILATLDTDPQATMSAYLELGEPSAATVTVNMFRGLVSSPGHAGPLLTMAKIFEEAVLNGQALPSFRWEDPGEQKDPDKLSLKELKRLAEPIEEIKSNRYQPVGNWKKPPEWPLESGWPVDSTLAIGDDVQCELCDRNTCDCIINKLRDGITRLSDCGPKGQGVRAVAPDGGIHEAEVLGELVGELVPVDCHIDSWAMQFVRPDLGVPVAQIYTKNMGNWVRKVNHSCRPNAKFRVMKISGRWRMMLVAIKDIKHNEEVTADCGKTFLGRNKCLCSHCDSSAVPTPAISKGLG